MVIVTELGFGPGSGVLELTDAVLEITSAVIGAVTAIVISGAGPTPCTTTLFRQACRSSSPPAGSVSTTRIGSVAEAPAVDGPALFTLIA